MFGSPYVTVGFTFVPKVQNILQNISKVWTSGFMQSLSSYVFFHQKAIKEKEIPIEGLEFMGHGKEKPESSS